MTEPQALLPCTTCDTSGEILVGWSLATFHEPSEGVTAECPVCEGAGAVSRETVEDWEGRLPEADEASEMVIARMSEPEYDEERDL